MARSANDQQVVSDVKSWFIKAVLGLNLCPFAHKPYQQGSIRFELTNANNEEACLQDIYLNFQQLESQSEIETTVLICPNIFSSFEDYNQFLDVLDTLIENEGWQGIFQIASFHPDYVFADTDHKDRANWTNRSPYPLFHLIREQSITAANQSSVDVGKVPENNILKLRSLTTQQIEEIFTHSQTKN